MSAASNLTLWHRCAAVAAAVVLIAATCAAPSESHAQFRHQRAAKGAADGRVPGFANRAPRFNALNRGPNTRFGNRGFGNQGRFNQGRGFTNRDPRMRAVNGANPQMRQVQRFSHQREMFAVRARMPVFPLPGERNFTGIPPVSESRYLNTEMVCQWGPEVTQQRIAEIARQHNLTIVSQQPSALTGGTLVRFRIDGNRAPRDVVRAMEAEQIISQPNYIYEAAQEMAAAQSNTGGSEQYVVNKLRLDEAHKIATGKGVTVAVIDSEVDRAHPEFGRAIAEEYDAVGQPDKPHTHGTGMAGAIVAQSRLVGVAPGARTLAIHAFSTSGPQQSAQATTQHIIAGLDWAISKGARIINMSFAGPYDPILALAMKRASEKGADPDRGGRQCGAEVAAALSRQPIRMSSASPRRMRTTSATRTPMRRRRSRSRLPGSASWCRPPPAPISSPPEPRSRPPMSAASRRSFWSAIRRPMRRPFSKS